MTSRGAEGFLLSAVVRLFGLVGWGCGLVLGRFRLPCGCCIVHGFMVGFKVGGGWALAWGLVLGFAGVKKEV